MSDNPITLAVLDMAGTTVADGGKPAADAPAALELSRVAQQLGHVKRGLSGMRLGVSPVNS